MIELSQNQSQIQHEPMPHVAEPAPSDLQETIESQLRDFTNETSLHVERHFIIGDGVRAKTAGLKEAIAQILNVSQAGLARSNGVVRVVVRPRGSKAEIEITDNGQPTSMDNGVMSHLQQARKLVHRGRGRLRVDTPEGCGATYTIEWPIEESFHQRS